MKKILLTAFEPFGGLEQNSSLEVIKQIKDHYDGILVEKEIIPVVYDPIIYRDLLNKHHPDVVLHCGQAGGRRNIDVEEIAVNFQYALSADNKGVIKKGEIIFDDGKTAYFSTIPVMEIVDHLQTLNLPIKVSLSAGGFVCNLSFYSSIYFSKKLKMNSKVGFVHFPYFEGQRNIGEYPSLQLEVMIDILERIINILGQ